MVTPEVKTIIASAVRIRRADDFVLLVRPTAGPAAGRWSLPMAQMPDHATAEDTARVVVRDGLRMDPGWFEFAETLTLEQGGFEIVVNVFDANGWSGEPRYAERDYEDAAWVNPDALVDVDAVPEIAAWLAGAEAPTPDDVRPDRLAAMLVESRGALLEAFAALAATDRERDLDAGWAPVDVLAHVGSAEAYYLREARQLLGQAPRAWRPFDPEQWEADRLYRARPSEGEAVARLDRIQTDTLRTVGGMVEAELAFYSIRGVGGAIRVGEAIATIATHDREHAEQLTKMLMHARTGRSA